MTPGPDEVPAAGRGHLRAAHADRENAIVVLQAAFVQGQLTKDEFDLRVGEALGSRTLADLASLTADISVRPALAESGGQPARTLAKAACRSGTCLLAAVALAEGAFLANVFGLLVLAFFAVMAASGFLGYGLLDSWQQRRTGGQLPSRPGRRDQRLAGGPTRPAPTCGPTGPGRTSRARPGQASGRDLASG